MAFNCGVSFGACLVRITRVDENGNVIAGENTYVTDKPDLASGSTRTSRRATLLGAQRLRLLHLAAQVPGHLQLVGALAADRDARAGA